MASNTHAKKKKCFLSVLLGVCTRLKKGRIYSNMTGIHRRTGGGSVWPMRPDGFRVSLLITLMWLSHEDIYNGYSTFVSGRAVPGMQK